MTKRTTKLSNNQQQQRLVTFLLVGALLPGESSMVIIVPLDALSSRSSVRRNYIHLAETKETKQKPSWQTRLD